VSKTQRNEPTQKQPKPRQLKRQRLNDLMQADSPQPEPRPEPVHWQPMG
jgi:hypothetical protein